MIGSAAHILAQRRDIQTQVREDPDLLGAFLEEVLRYEPPFRGHYRHVVNDTTLCGVDLSAGSRLVLLWGAANRDPSHFQDANEFRLDRTDAKGHVSFGKGAHFCVGAALARLEAHIALRAVLDRTSRIEAVDIGELFARTAHFEATATGRWLPSLLVRRLESLELSLA